MISLNRRRNWSPKALKEVQTRDLDSHGGYWKHIKHSDIVDALLWDCNYRKWAPENVKIVVSENQVEMAMSCQVTIPEVDDRLMPYMKAFIGLTSSNSGHRRNHVYAGAFWPHGGRFLASDLAHSRKRTMKFLPDEFVDKALDSYVKVMRRTRRAVKRLNEREISPDSIKDLLILAGRRKLMPWSRIGEVDNKFKASNNQTAWRLLVVFNKVVVKKNPPLVQMQQMHGFRKLLQESFYLEEESRC